MQVQMTFYIQWRLPCSQVNSALHPSGVAKSSTCFGGGKGGKVTSAGWQVTLGDLIWHVISRSGVVISITNCYIRFTYLLTLSKVTPMVKFSWRYNNFFRNKEPNWKNAPSRNVEESFKKFLNPDLEVSPFVRRGFSQCLLDTPPAVHTQTASS